MGRECWKRLVRLRESNLCHRSDDNHYPNTRPSSGQHKSVTPGTRSGSSPPHVPSVTHPSASTLMQTNPWRGAGPCTKSGQGEPVTTSLWSLTVKTKLTWRLASGKSTSDSTMQRREPGRRTLTGDASMELVFYEREPVRGKAHLEARPQSGTQWREWGTRTQVHGCTTGLPALPRVFELGVPPTLCRLFTR